MKHLQLFLAASILQLVCLVKVVHASLATKAYGKLHGSNPVARELQEAQCTDTAYLKNGAEIKVEIFLPVDGSVYYVEPGGEVDVDILGKATIGTSPVTDVHVTFGMDVSQSAGRQSGDDCGNIVECQQAAILALDELAAPITEDVGFTSYYVNGTTHFSPDYLAEAGSNEFIQAVSDETWKRCSAKCTNFVAGLEGALKSLKATKSKYPFLLFMSDGRANIGGSDKFEAAVQELVATGVEAYTFAIGDKSSCTFDFGHGTLQAIAEATGGVCFDVMNPGELPDLLDGFFSTNMTDVELTVDKDPTNSFVPEYSNPPWFLGPDYTDATGTNPSTPGEYEVCLEATGENRGSSTTVKCCVNYEVKTGVPSMKPTMKPAMKPTMPPKPMKPTAKPVKPGHWKRNNKHRPRRNRRLRL